MGSNAKLLLVAVCVAVVLVHSDRVHASKIEAAAYRGGAASNAAAAAQAVAQQRQPVAAAQTPQTAAARTKVVAAAYRDKPSLKDYYYGKKGEDYDQAGVYGNPGYNAQYPNPAYTTPAYQAQTYIAQPTYATTQQPQPQPQPQLATTSYYTSTPQQPQYSYHQYPTAAYPKPAYPQQPYPQPKDDYGQAPQYQYPAYPTQPQQPYTQPGYEQPEGYGYTPAPAPAPYVQKPVYYPPPAPYQPPYYAPTPYAGNYDKSGKGYYSKPAPQSICLSETFGAYYTQAYDDYITDEHQLSGVVSAFMGCKDRLTLGGMCSYTCYDGQYFERFVGVTTRIVTAPPQDWDTVDPWDHPVYCAWDLGLMAAKSLPAPPKVSQTGFNFSCDFTIKAICCDDVVPHVRYGGDVDLGDDGSAGGGGGGCGGGCDGGCTGDGCDPGCDGSGDCTGTGGTNTGNKKATDKGKFNIASKSKKSSRVRRASVLGSTHEVGFTSIGNAKVTGGVRTPKQNAATSMQAKSKAQPAMLTPAVPAASPATLAKPAAQLPVLQASTTSSAPAASMKIKARSAAVSTAAVNMANRQSHPSRAKPCK